MPPSAATPQDIAIVALAGVLVAHLRKQFEKRSLESGEELRQDEAPPPILVQIDGPGATDLLDRVDIELRPRHRSGRSPHWMVIRFDAWQYQRVQPPWWWLVAAFDKQLRRAQRSQGLLPWLVARGRDYRWRVVRILPDLWMLPLLAVAAVALDATSLKDMSSLLTKAVTAIAGLTAVVVLISSAYNAFRRHMFLFSPADDRALVRTRDPMADLQARYSFLLRSAGGPVAILIENLDRCSAKYVVELLEGIQTLLKHRPRGRNEPALVAFIVAADQAWLCNSFVEVYHKLAGSSAQPGRPFGLEFLDRVFDHAMRLPTVPAMIPRPTPGDAAETCDLAERRIRGAEQEIKIREIVAEAEAAAAFDGRPPRPVQQIRLAAVEQLGALEDQLGDSPCSDTTYQLDEMIAGLDAAGAVRAQLRTGYCAHRTAQLLGGHEIDAGEHAIRKLALWTILALNWPLLARHLMTNPEDIDCLRDKAVPAGVGPELEEVFRDRRAVQVAQGWPGAAELTAAEVRRYTVPIPTPPPPLGSVDPEPCQLQPALTVSLTV